MRQSFLERLFGWALIAILSIGGSLSAQTKSSANPFDAITPVVQAMITSKTIAGAVVMVSHKGKRVHYQASGLRDVDEGLPMQKDTLFRIYSMTKPITTVAAMILVEQGRFKLDDPVAQYLPEFKDITVYKDGKRLAAQHQMTIKQLMNHTAGFTYGYFGKTAVDAMYQKDHPLGRNTNMAMSKQLATYPLLFEPGARWHYSVATDVLGALIERTSGQSLGEFFKQQIFDPLDMKDTAFFVPKDKVSRFASVYRQGHALSDKYSSSDFLKEGRLQSGGGGLISTASDYMKFCQMLLSEGQLPHGRLLRTDTVRAMTKNQLPPPMKTYEHYGFGLGVMIQIQEWGDRGHLGEYGWDGIARTHFWISPKDQLIVIALSQRMPFSTELKKRLKPVIYQALKTVH